MKPWEAIVAFLVGVAIGLALLTFIVGVIAGAVLVATGGAS